MDLEMKFPLPYSFTLPWKVCSSLYESIIYTCLYLCNAWLQGWFSEILILYAILVSSARTIMSMFSYLNKCLWTFCCGRTNTWHISKRHCWYAWPIFLFCIFKTEHTLHLSRIMLSFFKKIILYAVFFTNI